MNVTSVTVIPDHLSMVAGEEYDSMNAIVCPTNADNRSVTWVSTRPEIAEIHPVTGHIQAKSEGRTIIRATANDGSGYSDVCYLTVTDEKVIESIILSDLTINIGESQTLCVTILPEDVEGKSISYASNSSSVATVDETGKVTGVGVGETCLFAYAQDGGGAFDSCKVIVRDPSVTSVTVVPDMATIPKGKSKVLTAIVKPDYATNKTVYWESDNPTIASVDRNRGVVTAVSGGDTTIYARSVEGNKKGTCNIHVDNRDKAYVITDVYYPAYREPIICEKIVFPSEKVWYITNLDTINFPWNQNESIPQMFCENVYTEKILDQGRVHYQGEIKEYTDEEMKLIYSLDPVAFAGYVKIYASSQAYGISNTDEIKRAIVGTKDEIFYLLFRREPKHFKRNITGEWIDAGSDEVTIEIMSESELLFGEQPVYDDYTSLLFWNFVADMITAATNLFIDNDMAGKAIEIIVKYYAVKSAINDPNVDVNFSDYLKAVMADEIVETGEALVNPSEYIFSNYTPGWFQTLHAATSDLDALTEAFSSGPNYYSELVEYCADELDYQIILVDGNNVETYLTEINDYLKNNDQ